MKTSNWELDPKKFLSREDIERMLSVVSHQANSGSNVVARDLFILRLGLATGLRVMEIAALSCGDLTLTDCLPSLWVGKGKGQKSRRVYFNEIFKKQCQEFLAWKQSIGESILPEQPLLLSNITGGHLTTRAIQKAFKRCAKKAGLPSYYSIHCLRHTYACLLLKAGNWNLRLVQKQLGHSKITTTQIYADVMVMDIKKALERLK
jgi:site-specific recombinase XerD